jgi:beta-mannanase
LREIYGGRYDVYRRDWARAAENWGHPFFLKFDHEMDDHWSYPWSEQLNGNQPVDYVKRCYQRNMGLMSNTVTASTTPLEAVYPGDEYIDWTCLHGYNGGGKS